MERRFCSHHPKVAVVRVGSVGASFAYSLMIRGLVSEVSLIDVNPEKATGEAMDLEHGLPFVQPARIKAGDYWECADADIVVIAAGAAQKPGESRLSLVKRNVAVFKQVIPRIKERNNQCILLVATNPVDIMSCTSLKLSGFLLNRVIGSDTLLDTSRLCSLLSEHFRIDSRNVHAYITGEHGDSEVPVWSSASVAGVKIEDYCPICGMKYDEQYFNKIFEEVKNAAYKIIDRKGATYYAIGLGLTRIVESIIRDENAILTVSSLLKDYYGVSGVCLSAPSILNRDGIVQTVKVPLEDSEITMFQKSASAVAKVISSLDI